MGFGINRENAKVPAEEVDQGYAEVAATVTPDPRAGYRRAGRIDTEIPHHHHEARKRGDENHLRTCQPIVIPIQKNMCQRPRDVTHREIRRHDQQRHQPKLWTKVVSVDVVTKREPGQNAQGLVAPTNDEGDDKKDDKVSPPVSTDPMYDGKAHEYGHRNERHEVLQMGVVQQPGGTHEHVKSNENPKQPVRYSRLIAHGGCCPAFHGRRRGTYLSGLRISAIQNLFKIFSRRMSIKCV